MKKLLTLALASALVPQPETVSARSLTNDQIEVMEAVHDFFAALRSEDKTALATMMLPEAVIFVHNRMDSDNPRVDVVPVADHLSNWLASASGVNELMNYDTILVDGDMAQVWGPYIFEVSGKLSHCGINSLSLVRTEQGWKVGNTSFSMLPPAQCTEIVEDVNEMWEMQQ